jgi:hypothetical protein
MVTAVWALAAALATPPAGVEFFEKKIRPVLAEKCYACHSSKTVVTSGLVLDTRAGMQKGGNRGALIIAGDPEGSRLIKALSYQDPELKMPPTGRLTDAQIADFASWIKMGAPDPREETPATLAAAPAKGKFWAFEPIRNHQPPPVKNTRWAASPIDRFLLAKWEKDSLTPAPAADRRTLIRRVTFDLTGLPPTPQEVADFLADRSPKAYEKLVDRLLASPHYDERWARHWLDLVRYGETSGHEFDSDKVDVWRYRDYVIRSFNEDIPYDQFMREHIAGDLLVNARPEAKLGTGFFGLGEERNAADDIAGVRAERNENQIDVLGKTFLGLTVACARCHDHKFDPISTADYYGLWGILDSTRLIEVNIDPPSQRREIEALHQKIAAASGAIGRAAGPLWSEQAKRLKETLLKPNEAWKGYLDQAGKEPDHVFYPFAELSKASDKPFAERLAAVRKELEEWNQEAETRRDVVFADFGRGSYEGWEIQGPAFGAAPQADVPPNQMLSGHQGGALANSFGGGSEKLTGVLTSKGFHIQKPFVHVRMAGTVDSTRRREHGVLRLTVQVPGRPAFVNAQKNGVFQWQTANVRRLAGELAYLVIADRATTGHIAVDKILFSDANRPPKFAGPPNRYVLAALAQPGIDSAEALAEAYQRVFVEALEAGADDRDTRWLRSALSPAGKLEEAPSLPAEVAELQKQREEAEKALPESAYGMVAQEELAHDQAIQVRGDPRNLGAVVPRRFLTVLGGQPCNEGSGRRQLAEALASPQNPLPARVLVNRIWQHHFGRGLVGSPDNFGLTGDRPADPELLDYLAKRFMEDGWSIKKLHRRLLLTSAYRMESRPETRAAMPARRLEAEAIRDAMLAVAGTLNRTMFGPPVPPHISPYQDGRGKPAKSGPLDGDGRRSIYIGVRRNFLTPLFLAFDYPLPITTIGRRNVSTVPSQALMLMNNEFVAGQAEKWAKRVTAAIPKPRERIQDMFLTAFGRPAEAREIRDVEQFVAEQSGRHEGATPEDVRVWTDVAHALFNSKEFIFVR